MGRQSFIRILAISKLIIIKGDQERKLNLPISMLCDRETTNMAKS